MMKEWFTTKELAELNLQSLPNTPRGILKKAKKEEWKSRPRKATGGGLEYHISNLDEDIQVNLIEKLVATNQISDKKYVPLEKITNEDRRNARIVILTLFEKLLKTSGIGILRAEKAFLKLYRSQNPDFAPQWVYEIYPDFSVQSLRLWRSSKDKNDALSLKPKYGNRRNTGVLDLAHDGEVKQFIIALITKKSHLKAGHIRDFVRSKFGNTLDVNGTEKTLPNIRTFERFIYNWKQENDDIWLRLTDPDASKNKNMVAFGKADAGVERLNQKWEIDASPVDALCVDGRYNLYAIIDIWSRRALFLVSKTPKTEASLTLIRRAIKEWGVPEVIKTDNGSDFTSKRFQTALIALGIEQSLCTPYSPEQKPFVERVIKTLQHDIMPLMPGFVGHSVADRKKIEAVKAFSARLGESDKEAFAIQMDHEELQTHIDNWAEAKYGHEKHSTLGMSPFQKAASWRQPVKKIDNDRALDLLLAPIASGDGWRTVTKKGIRVESAHFIAPELGLYVGKQVFVRFDPRDMGKIYVFDKQEEFICEAWNPERSGIDRQAVTAMAKAEQKRRYKEETQEIKRIQRGIKPEDLINDYLKDQIKAANNITTLPKAEDIHTSPSLEEAAKATRHYNFQDNVTVTEDQKREHEKFKEDFYARQKEAEKPVDLFDKNTDTGQRNLMFGVMRRLENNQYVPTEDLEWFEGFKETSAYRSNITMYQQFGDAWLKIGDIKYEP